MAFTKERGNDVPGIPRPVAHAEQTDGTIGPEKPDEQALRHPGTGFGDAA